MTRGGSSPATHLVHGTCIAFGTAGVLFRGEPGSGKSDLALRCLCNLSPPAQLVADDQVVLRESDGTLIASAPEQLMSLMEVRGVGILRFDAIVEATLVLVIDLTPREAVPRLPEEPPEMCEILGIAVPVLHLCPFDASAPVKVRLAVQEHFSG